MAPAPVPRLLLLTIGLAASSLGFARLEVIAVATEDSVPPDKLKDLAAAVHMPFIRRLKGPYSTLGAVPTNYVIDRRGIVRYAKARAFTVDDLNDLLVPLLREQIPETSSLEEQAQPPASPLAPQEASTPRF